MAVIYTDGDLPWAWLPRLGCSSPMVASVSRGLKPMGDCVKGSGEVPHDELAPPMLELDDAEGELVDAAPPIW